jgi:PelA/Pel-15E family pectate lyase
MMMRTNYNLRRRLAAGALLCLVTLGTSAQIGQTNGLRRTDDAFFKTEEARRIGDALLRYQRVTGGWPKNIDMTRPLTATQQDSLAREQQRRDDSTIDNGATTTQMRFLARLYRQTHDSRYRTAFDKATQYLLDGQYDNGGWPQFWPNPKGYQVHITYNDDAIANTLQLLGDIASHQAPYDGNLTTPALRSKAAKAFDKGIDCILKTQIVVDGKPTVWCQQHDHVTFKPASARAFELVSYCSAETAGLLRLLMTLPKPDDRVKQAIHGGMQWLDEHKITGYRYIHVRKDDPNDMTRLEPDPTAPPLWARYYDIDRGEPFVCDRDGIPRRQLSEIGTERRNGYAWYTTRPGELYKLYDEWAARHDAQRRRNISLNSPGGNVRGVFQMFRHDQIDTSLYDVIVAPGSKIQDAVAKAPQEGTKPFKILVRKGTYNEKVIIDRPNIVLVGENRDSTVIVFAEARKNMKEQLWNGRKVGPGVITLLDNADDCLISGLTVYNNYGTTVEATTEHQFAIYGQATRTIVINSNIWSDGNDALALWGKNGMYYHADLKLRCPGVDFLCPRGWCYVTRCHFVGDGRAIVWHDGRGDKDQKLVITNSDFDALRPTILGRYHHDHQFYFINCRLTANILDTNISYAYTDKVLDPCPWGQRTYYYGCTREGGHSGWLANNLHEAEKAPAFYGVTALWTFGGRWDPEARLRELWRVVEY